ncbi:hypothetical protein FNSP10_21270 [Fusobacterium nucleatum]|nr:hypothetical protein FNCP10_03020 [Fusobacterium nucleatum]BEP08753.1 hypothetical protein FNSP10_21270 [Fusobacterium nucleatum]
MKQNYKIFLLVAEELSYSKAAKKAYVTQQCVSNHIQRLEKELNTKLFSKKTSIQLTEAGKILYNAIKNMEIISNNATKSIREISAGTKGSFTMGISTSRAKIILPNVLKKYHKYFPDIEISFYVNDTSILEKKLLDGEIDLFLGINTSQNENFKHTFLLNDSMHLIISKSLFQNYFATKDLEKFKSGVDLINFSEVPFTLYYETGALNLIIKQHLLFEGIKFNKIPYYISDCDTQIHLCQSGITAAIVPKMLSLNLKEYNLECKSEDEVYIFPINNFNYPLRIDLVNNVNVEQPFYINSFYQIVKGEIEKLMNL